MLPQDPDPLSHIPWHPAFIEALMLELAPYADALEFFPEYQLTSEPLRIDCVVIKKPKEVTIGKNIGSIFREANIIEYKSPDDYVSVGDYYKVYGYACLYAALEKKNIRTLSVSFVESHYPRELLRHLEVERGYAVAERWPGIYTVSGDILPIQVIDSRELEEEENLWLKSLSNRLDLGALGRVAEAITRQGKGARIGAYLEAIAQANTDALQEAGQMSSTLTLEQVFEKNGFYARAEKRMEARIEARLEAKIEKRVEAKVEKRVEAKIEERTALGIAQNLISKGFSPEEVADITQLDLEKVKSLYARDQN